MAFASPFPLIFVVSHLQQRLVLFPAILGGSFSEYTDQGLLCSGTSIVKFHLRRTQTGFIPVDLLTQAVTTTLFCWASGFRIIISPFSFLFCFYIMTFRHIPSVVLVGKKAIFEYF